MEKELIKFERFLDSLTGKFKAKKLMHYLVKKLMYYLNVLLENSEIFKYILERVYSDPRNPFTTSYHDFILDINYGMDTQEALEILAEAIINRRIQEQKYNKFVVF